jgi:hypothetical protein
MIAEAALWIKGAKFNVHNGHDSRLHRPCTRTPYLSLVESRKRFTSNERRGDRRLTNKLCPDVQNGHIPAAYRAARPFQDSEVE